MEKREFHSRRLVPDREGELQDNLDPHLQRECGRGLRALPIAFLYSRRPEEEMALLKSVQRVVSLLDESIRAIDG